MEEESRGNAKTTGPMWVKLGSDLDQVGVNRAGSGKRELEAALRIGFKAPARMESSMAKWPQLQGKQSGCSGGETGVRGRKQRGFGSECVDPYCR